MEDGSTNWPKDFSRVSGGGLIESTIHNRVSALAVLDLNKLRSGSNGLGAPGDGTFGACSLNGFRQ